MAPPAAAAMIEIYVASYNGRPAPTNLRAAMGADGGTLGRGADNQLVLPDPARHVSRVQARIRFDGTGFLIANVSEANPLFLNEEVIEAGAEKPLEVGDELRIGLYVLGVRVATATAVGAGATNAPSAAAPAARGAADPMAGLGGGPGGPNPFADLLGTSVTPPVLPADAPSPLPAAGGTPAPMLPPTDPFADLLRPGPPSAARPAPSGASGGVPPNRKPAGGIPDDFDPFAMPSSAPRNTDDPLRDLAGSSIDLSAVDTTPKRSSLLEFDLAPDARRQDSLHGGTPSLVDSQQVVDPLQLFGGDDHRLLNSDQGDPLGRGMPMPDNVPEIGAHFVPPRGVPETPARPPLARPSPQAPRTSPPEPPPVAAPRRVPGAAPVTGTGNAASADMPQARAPSRPAVASPEGDALLAAFLKGARIAESAAPVQLTPALMEVMGALVFQATAGAMELIAARQITKREIRADVTMIGARGNNPLKFLPTPEAAIMQMLGPKMPGFMTTGEAMRDAFEDLRAHEVGVIAGVRAALAEVLRRFDPALLQERLGKGGLLDTLVPTARRAKLWDLFEARFQELYREANDDFHSMFGEAFIKAYEEQIEEERVRRGRL